MSSVTSGGTTGTQSFRYDASSQGISRHETISGGSWSNSWTDQWYRMGGTTMWHTSNRFDPRRGAGDPGARYTVRSGDTLGGIAQALWGDASLWYKLAEANGLTATSSLTEGQSLAIPAGVWRSQQNAKTYIPYDAQKFLNLSEPSPLYPAPPPPPPAKKGGCGVFGQILLIVVAIAIVAIVAPPLVGTAFGVTGSTTVTVGTFGTLAVPTFGATGLTAAIGATAAAVVGGGIAAAAGSIISQGVGLATGIQDKFSWKAVGLSALSAGVGAGVGQIAGLAGKGFLAGAARGALGNAVTQGVATATGLQSKFDWAGVAVGAAVGGTVSGLGARFEQAKYAAPARSLESYGQQLVTGAAGALAGAATRSVLTGTDFGDNIAATLPDVIGSTIGNAVANGVAGKGAPRTGKGPLSSKGVQLASLDGVIGKFAKGEFNGAATEAREDLRDIMGYLRARAGGISAEEYVASLKDTIVVTANRLIDDGGRYVQSTYDALARQITNSLTGENIGRTTIASLANAVLPSSGNFVASYVSRSDATAFGNGVKQGTIGLVQSTIALGKALQDVGPLGQVNALLQRTTGYVLPGAPNANYALVPAANIGRAVGRYISTATPSSVAADVGSVYSAASGAISRFGALDAASQRAAILYGVGYALPQIASLAVGGEFAGAARGARLVVDVGQAGRIAVNEAAIAALSPSGGRLTTITVDSLSQARGLGSLGEDAVGIIRGKTRVDVPGTDRFRLPDQINRFVLQEVKNVGRQSYTSQLRDFVTIAQDRGIPFELYVRPSTKLNGPLNDAILRGDIVKKYILGAR